MKKTLNFITTIILILLLSSCFMGRLDLFTLPLEEDIYLLNDNLEGFESYNEHLITYISISLKETNNTMDINNKLDLNLMGDYSFEEIKVFEIEFMLGLDNNEPIKYDLLFLGNANPGRPNAYSFETYIDEFDFKVNKIRVVLDLNIHIGGDRLKLAYYYIQFYNPNSNTSIMVKLRNELQSTRDESLKQLINTFNSFNREDYNQANWKRIHNIYDYNRIAINRATTKEDILDFLNNALMDFDEVVKVDSDL